MTLTAYTERSDDVVLLYLRDHRAPFHNNGDGTSTAVFSAPDLLGLHHVGVNVLSHDTLFDDTVAYNSLAWIVPIWVGDAPPVVWP